MDAWGYPVLEPGQSYTTVGSFTVPQNSFAGKWFVSCWVDVTDTTDESNEANNQANVPIQVDPPPLPDLVIGSVTISPSYSWQPSAVHVQVLNRGPGGVDPGFPLTEPVVRISVNGKEVDALGNLQMPAYSSEIVSSDVTLVIQAAVGDRLTGAAREAARTAALDVMNAPAAAEAAALLAARAAAREAHAARAARTDAVLIETVDIWIEATQTA